jgi:hypothetical protein
MAFPKRAKALAIAKEFKELTVTLGYGNQLCRLDRSCKDFQGMSGTIGFNIGSQSVW